MREILNDFYRSQRERDASETQAQSGTRDRTWWFRANALKTD